MTNRSSQTSSKYNLKIDRDLYSNILSARVAIGYCKFTVIDCRIDTFTIINCKTFTLKYCFAKTHCICSVQDIT